MNYPKITVVTPSYNQGHYIEQTICSVLDQGYPNLEYIIIDGGSKDDSVSIIKKYEKHLAYWVSEKDRGQSDAINKGYRKATGEIFNWLNSDDYYEPRALFKVADAFLKNPELQVYCGISRVFGEDKEFHTKGTDVYPGNINKTIGWPRIDQPETFFKKSVWDTIGGVDERFHYVMDKELWVRFLLYYGLAGVKKEDELLVHFRHHGESKTVSQSDNFVTETYRLFYTLADKHGLKKEAELLSSMIGSTDKYDINYEQRHGDMPSIVNYFLFYVLSEAYASNDMKRFRLVKPYIDTAKLSSEDQRSYNKMNFIEKYVPVDIKKVWNLIGR